jgi:hypothetical protein
VKKFHFPLERVRQWRENQLALEEIRLEEMETQRLRIDAGLADLAREKAAGEQAVLDMDAPDALTLRSLDEFRRFSGRRRAALQQDRAAAEARIAAQRLRIVEAQRNVRLLDKLQARRRRLWDIAFDREIEEQAAEAFRARPRAPR